MHIDGPNQIPMSLKTTLFTDPLPIVRLVLMSTGRTPAAGSSFRAGEARHVGLFAFVGEIVHVFAIFPQGHTLVMVSPMVVVAYSVGIANEDGSHLLLHTKVNHFSCGFVAHIPHTPLHTAALLVLGLLQLLPPFRVFFAPTLLFRKCAKLLISLSLQGADTTPGDNQSFCGVRGHCCKVNFSQVYRRVNSARSLFSL
jgi:hypothetical protein